MASFPHLRLVNVAIGLTATAILCFVWAVFIPIKEGKATVYSFTNTLALFAEQLTNLLFIAALCAWVLAGLVAFVKLWQRYHKRSTQTVAGE